MELKKRDTLHMLTEGIPIYKNAIMPRYEKDERLKIQREVHVPPESLFMAIGYDGAVTDQAPVAGNRHYRKYYMDELENNREIFKHSPFYKTPVMRGQERGLKAGLFDKLLGIGKTEQGSLSSLKEVGWFKGHVSVYNEAERETQAGQKASKLASIVKLLQDVHTKKYGEPLRIDPRNLFLQSADSKNKFKRRLIDMEVHSEELMRLLVEAGQEQQLLKQLQTP